MKVPTIDLSANGKSFTNIDDFVSVLSSPDGSLKTDDIVYVGYGIDDEKFSSYDGIDVKGKVVLFKSRRAKKC